MYVQIYPLQNAGSVTHSQVKGKAFNAQYTLTDFRDTTAKVQSFVSGLPVTISATNNKDQALLFNTINGNPVLDVDLKRQFIAFDLIGQTPFQIKISYTCIPRNLQCDSHAPIVNISYQLAQNYQLGLQNIPQTTIEQQSLSKDVSGLRIRKLPKLDRQ